MTPNEHLGFHVGAAWRDCQLQLGNVGFAADYVRLPLAQTYVPTGLGSNLTVAAGYAENVKCRMDIRDDDFSLRTIHSNCVANQALLVL